jgi:uncharacterized RDD family membrane protein YckC
VQQRRPSRSEQPTKGVGGLAVEAAAALIAVGARAGVAAARATAGRPLPEAVGRSLADHHVVERVIAELAADDRLAETVRRLVDDPEFRRVVLSAADSELAGEVVEHLLDNPAVEAALTRQTRTYADDLVDGVRARVGRLDDAASLPSARSATDYAGLASRGAAFALDALLVELGVLASASLLAVVTTLFGDIGPDWLVALLLASGTTVVAVTYFVAFWSLAGQTPGMRLLGIRVAREADRRPPGPARAVVRLAGLVLSIAVLFLGFLPAVFDRKRRGVHDMLAGTVVVRTAGAD